jgi:hypothetical protein
MLPYHGVIHNESLLVFDQLNAISTNRTGNHLSEGSILTTKHSNSTIPLPNAATNERDIKDTEDTENTAMCMTSFHPLWRKGNSACVFDFHQLHMAIVTNAYTWL